MRPVTRIELLMDAIRQIRSRGAAFTSNLFAGADQMQGWIERGELRCVEGAGALLLFRQDRGFHRIYHAAADFGTLSATLASLATRATVPATLISDLVGPPELICSIARIYAEHGFSEYARLIRMARGGVSPCDTPPRCNIASAGLDTVPAISRFLEERLDPLVDQIPTVSNLKAAATSGEILAVWRSAKPAGVLIFGNSKLSATLRYWYVDRDFQGQGIGSGLMKAFFHSCPDARRVVLWVAAVNAESIAKYRHFGFNPERMEDRIMAKTH